MQKLVVIKDRVAGTCDTLLNAINLDVLKRDLKRLLCSEQGRQMLANYDDKDVLVVGEFDINTGAIKSCEPTFVFSMTEVAEDLKLEIEVAKARNERIKKAAEISVEKEVEITEKEGEKHA